MGIPDTSLFDLLHKFGIGFLGEQVIFHFLVCLLTLRCLITILSTRVVSVIQTITSFLTDTIAKVVVSGCVSIV